MYAYLVENDRLEKDDALEKEEVFAAVYPKMDYDDAQMRQVMHFLLKAVEEFLIYEEWTEDPVKARITLARVYRRRQLGKLFQRTLDSAKDLQEKQPLRNLSYLENTYLLEQEQYNYLSGLRRTVPLNLQEVSNALDINFISTKLRQACLMLAHQTVFKVEYKIGLLDKLLEFVEQEAPFNTPAISIYYHSYKALKERDSETHFQLLKQALLKYEDLFPESEIRDIYLLAINYCIGRMNAGVKQYVRETFDLYKRGLEKKILLQDGFVSRFTFRNVVTNGTLLEEFEWTEHFINDFQQYLEEQYRESIVHYSMAKLHFEKKDYDQAMTLLHQVEYDDILMTLNARTMLMKMYYELDEFNPLDSLLESMRMYMRRKKVMGYHKSNFKNIIHLTKKLANVNPYDQKQTGLLKEEIENANPLTEKKWLLAQLEGDFLKEKRLFQKSLTLLLKQPLLFIF
ncbi:MAG: hypothetical protein IPJ40_15825 [Saprospirales bacterium]|nr:hypothetical protein [Saprospirales bacterium]